MISSVVVQFVDNYNNANKYITPTMLIVASVGFGGYQVSLLVLPLASESFQTSVSSYKVCKQPRLVVLNSFVLRRLTQ